MGKIITQITAILVVISSIGTGVWTLESRYALATELQKTKIELKILKLDDRLERLLEQQIFLEGLLRKNPNSTTTQDRLKKIKSRIKKIEKQIENLEGGES